MNRYNLYDIREREYVLKSATPKQINEYLKKSIRLDWYSRPGRIYKDRYKIEACGGYIDKQEKKMPAGFEEEWRAMQKLFGIESV